MTCISDIDEQGINRNLKVRYQRDEIYVSFFQMQLKLLLELILNQTHIIRKKGHPVSHDLSSSIIYYFYTV